MSQTVQRSFAYFQNKASPTVLFPFTRMRPSIFQEDHNLFYVKDIGECITPVCVCRSFPVRISPPVIYPTVWCTTRTPQICHQNKLQHLALSKMFDRSFWTDTYCLLPTHKPVCVSISSLGHH